MRLLGMNKDTLGEEGQENLRFDLRCRLSRGVCESQKERQAQNEVQSG